VIGIIVNGTLGFHAVHVLGKITAICLRVVLEAILAFP